MTPERDVLSVDRIACRWKLTLPCDEIFAKCYLHSNLNVALHVAHKIKDYYIVLDFSGVLLRTCPNTTNNWKKYKNPFVTYKTRVREFLLTLLHNFKTILWTCSR